MSVKYKTEGKRELDKVILEKLRTLLPEENVLFDEPMSAHCSFKIGGPADALVYADGAEDIIKVLNFAEEYGIPVTVIGNGTNLLVSDEGVEGIVLAVKSRESYVFSPDADLKESGCETRDAFLKNRTIPAAQRGFSEEKTEEACSDRNDEDLAESESRTETERIRLRVPAGVLLSAFAKAAAKAGFSGTEPLAGIPGSVGGAVAMNAGAYGGEIKDIIVGAEVIIKEEQAGKEFPPTKDSSDGINTNPEAEGRNTESEANGEKTEPETDAKNTDFRSNSGKKNSRYRLVTLSKEELALEYRNSAVLKKGYIVVSALFELEKGSAEESLAKIADFNGRRRDKQPLEYPSAGSTFKRPTGYFAGKLIDDAGLRGFRVGDAQVSEKHCGFVINAGKATSAEVEELIRQVREKVHATSGIWLEPEVRIMGRANRK